MSEWEEKRKVHIRQMLLALEHRQRCIVLICLSNYHIYLYECAWSDRPQKRTHADARTVKVNFITPTEKFTPGKHTHTYFRLLLITLYTHPSVHTNVCCEWATLYSHEHSSRARANIYGVCARIYFWTLWSWFTYIRVHRQLQTIHIRSAHMHRHAHTSRRVSDIIFCRNKSMTFARQRSPDVCT